MTLQEILRAKGQTVHSIEPTATLMDVACKMGELNIGSLIVLDREGRLAGIITERDVLRAVANRRATLASMTVAQHMTRDMVTAPPHLEVPEVMGLMTQRRIRHLPVLDNGQLVGLVSIGDVVKAQHDALCLENHYLMSYIQSQ